MPRRSMTGVSSAVRVLVAIGLVTAAWSCGDSSVTINPGPDPVMPRITVISPNSGASAGGDTVTVFTVDFQDDFTIHLPTVIFDTAPATWVNALDSRTLGVVTPPDPNPIPSGLRAVDVAVITAGGLESATLADGFTYISVSGPCLEVLPGSGPVAGGQIVIVNSLGPCTWSLTAGSVPTFDGIPAVGATLISSQTIECLTPPGARTGPVDVEVPGRDPLGNPCRCIVTDGYTYQ